MPAPATLLLNRARTTLGPEDASNRDRYRSVTYRYLLRSMRIP